MSPVLVYDLRRLDRGEVYTPHKACYKCEKDKMTMQHYVCVLLRYDTTKDLYALPQVILAFRKASDGGLWAMM